MFKIKKREYIYKKTATGQLVTHFSHLSEYIEGVAVATHWRLEVERAHLPTQLWKI